MEILDNVSIEYKLHDDNNRTTIKSCCYHFLSSAELFMGQQTLEEEISREKKQFSTKENIEDPERCSSIHKNQILYGTRKRSLYLDYTFNILKNSPKQIVPYTCEKDFIFNIRNYSKTFYQSENSKKGLQFKSYYDLLSDYISLHSDEKKVTFNSEYSAYQFEKLHYSIQYSNCVRNFLTKHIPNFDV